MLIGESTKIRAENNYLGGKLPDASDVEYKLAKYASEVVWVMLIDGYYWYVSKEAAY